MISIDINSFDNINDRLSNLDKDAMLRDVALTVYARMRKRVHIDGEAADGSQIGSYSKGYLTVRSGQFQNNKKKRGVGFQKSGKQTGSYSKGAKLGQKRVYYNRGTDQKVILSMTRQMENDMSVIETDNGYGIGFSNPDNFKKATWNEARYKKTIWKLSDEENVMVINVVNDHLNKALNDK